MRQKIYVKFYFLNIMSNKKKAYNKNVFEILLIRNAAQQKKCINLQYC